MEPLRSEQSQTNPTARARVSSDAQSYSTAQSTGRGLSGALSGGSGVSGVRTLPHARPSAARGFAGHGANDIGRSGEPGYLDKSVTEKFTSLPLVDEEGNENVSVPFLSV